MSCSTHHQIEHTYTGPVDDELGDSMLACDQEVGWGDPVFYYLTTLAVLLHVIVVARNDTRALVQ